MSGVNQLRKSLKRGEVYRRNELIKWSNAVDRHLDILVDEGTLQKLSRGVYYYPKETVFGKTPPDEQVLIRSFLKDNNFILTSPNDYNQLGVGTTQLYNQRIVYNHKRHGEFKIGGRKFSFRLKPRFPKKITREFLLVDLVNNLKTIAEDSNRILKNISSEVGKVDRKKLETMVDLYGNVKTKKIYQVLLNSKEIHGVSTQS
jgi:hypothetical protein